LTLSGVLPSRLRRYGFACAFLLLVAVVIVAGCGSGRMVLPVTIDPNTQITPADSRELTNHERAVQGISAILSKDLKLPMPERVTVYVYSSRQVFEQGLVRDANVSPVRAAELSDFAIGVGRRRQLLFNDEAYDHRGREWLRLIAHELAHVSQIELAQGEGRAEQWLAEGMAEWIAFSVLERLGLDTVQNRRTIAAAGIRTHAALVAAKLDLDTLGTPRGFTVRHLKEGSLPTYQLAFLMADYLITRDGFDRTVQYFKGFGQGGGRRDTFRVAFHQTLEQFEDEVLGHLKTIVR
jgi:hypothetical protein